jgi:hypothetical protein
MRIVTKTKHGMVAMVDVLGVGSKTLAESRDFLQRFTKFEVLLRDYTTRFFQRPRAAQD